MAAIEQLASLLREQGGLLGAATAEPVSGSNDPQLGARAAAYAPPATASQYALLVEAIREGYLQHYGQGRVVQTDDDDLALLAGDALYALGLDRLAELGDLHAVAELADVISLCAQLQAEKRQERCEQLWEAAAFALTRAPDPAHAALKASLRAGASGQGA